MREPTTIRGYINMIRKIELICPTFLDGFEKLDEETKWMLKELSASISNIINEIEIKK